MNGSHPEHSATVQSPEVLLMKQVAEGNERALVTLMDLWKGPLINFFYRSLCSREDAEDLTQTVFIRLYKAAPRYEARAKFSTFLFQIARRLLINEFRRKSRHPMDATDPADLRAIDPGLTNRRIQEIEEAFALAIAELPENQRTAILLLKQQELSYEEIAVIMESTESSVKTWIFRAREQLRVTLKEVL
ncbi:MAG: RNA polymerase sigma factor [Verrucomicrobiota bacterium]|nr:RNA polymerase sigma factor [Verrucomicrobiota bacterium]